MGKSGMKKRCLRFFKKNYFQTEKGFTMIELIVTITVLAVIAAFTIPSLLGFVDDAKAKDCRSKTNDIKRSYTDLVVDKGVEVPTKYRSFSIVDKIVIDKYGGETQVLDTEDETGSKVEKVYKGICPSGGIYLIQFVDTEESKGTEVEMHILCSCEGHTSDKAGVTHIAIRTLENDIKSDNSFIVSYFNAHPTSTLDSTGKNFAPDVQKILEFLGVDTKTTCSWRIEKIGEDYNIYWTETFIDDLQEGSEIYVTKYNVSTGKFYHAKTEVGVHSDGEKDIKHIETNANWIEDK